MDTGDKKFSELLKKIEELKQSGTFDLSMEEDLSIAVMNLISLEEHFFFTAKKTGKREYLDLLGQTREIRKQMLGKLIDRHEGETWCITKHLLAATMRLIEVGTKLQSVGKQQEAEEVFASAYKVYALFWAVRLKLVDISNIKRIDADKPWTVDDLITKLVDCCSE